LQIIPGGLGKLAKAFNVQTMKEHFPHYWDPIAHGYPNLEYTGPIPSYEFFESKRTSLQEWKLLDKECGNNWNFLEYSYKYLHSDVKALFQILCSFFSEIGDTFQVNAIRNCSVPGIAFKTWKGHQLPIIHKNNQHICDLSQSYDSFLRQSYLGGIVD